MKLPDCVKTFKFLLIVLLLQCFWVTSVSANPILDDFATNAEAIAQLEGPGITISNFNVVSGSTRQFGRYTNGTLSTSPGPQIGIEEGLYMTTGRSSITIRGPNNASNKSDTIGTVYYDDQLRSIDPLAIYDTSIIQMQALTDGNYLKISFAFASEEYPEYVCSQFNDSFGMFVKEASLPDAPANWQNIALTPGGATPIAVNNINNGSCGAFANNYSPRILTNAQYFISNGDGSTPGANTNLQFDGFTIPFTVKTPVSSGTLYDVKIAIADAGDHILDSALFLKWLSGSEYKDDIDLELDLQADSTALNAGDDVVFTLVVANTGQDDSPEIKVDFPLPNGLTYVSDTSGGSYNSTTGVWTIPAGLAAFTGSTSITVTAVSGDDSMVVEAFAEVAEVAAQDIDSTPGNGAQSPAEDDEGTVSIEITAKRYISGNIFEDTTYGGGTGNAFGGAGTVGLASARIEVYDGNGNYIDAVTSGANGEYQLPALIDGNYFVRVVNDTVDSSRNGSDGSEMPVMTYRSDGTTAVADEIGGRYPALTDASANTVNARLDTNTLKFIDGDLNAQPAQAIQPITISGSDVGNANFGFNFNTVVNTNGTGQGSLDQFVKNSSKLKSDGIKQELPAAVADDYTTGDTVAVFMIPQSQLTSGQAVIHSSSILRIKKKNVIIDGRVQAANIGEGAVVLKGTDSSSLNGIKVNGSADNAVIRDLTLTDFRGSGVVISGTGSSNDAGATVTQVNAVDNGRYGVLIQNGAAHTKIINNTIANNDWAGISSDTSYHNTFSQNSIYDNGGLGIDLGADGVTENSNLDSWLNYPEVAAGSSISSNGSQVVTYDFDLDVPTNDHGYRVEFFSNTTLDPSGHGEGKVYLGYADINPVTGGLENYKGVFNANQAVPEGAQISVTLTEKTGPDTLGSTSEFSGVLDGSASVCTDLLSDPDAPLPVVTMNENAEIVELLEATDANGDPITYVIGDSADGQFFIVEDTAGALVDCTRIKFIKNDDVIETRNLSTIAGTQRVAPTAPTTITGGDFESPADTGNDNTYDLTIKAIDIHGNEVEKTLAVTVKDVNEKPRIITPSTVSYTERQTSVIVTLEAYDPEGDSVSYSVSGGVDSDQFTIDVETGELRFNTSPDFDSPTDENADNVYEVTVYVYDTQGYSSSKSLSVAVENDPDNNGINLRVRAMLQGAYDATTALMHDKLRVAGLIPAAQPYGSEPFSHSGVEQLEGSLLNAEEADAVVDWVLLGLHSVANPDQVAFSKAAVIQRDGDIVDAASGSTLISFPEARGEYYLSLRHRNHIGVISAAKLAGTNVPTIDFSQATTPTKGEHARLQSVAGDGMALLWNGDINHDQRLVTNGQGSDTNVMLSEILAAPDNVAFNKGYQLAGYYDSDLNMDGVAQFAGPGNDTNNLLMNIFLHPANDSFSNNFIVSGGIAAQQ